MIFNDIYFLNASHTKRWSATSGIVLVMVLIWYWYGYRPVSQQIAKLRQSIAQAQQLQQEYADGYKVQKDKKLSITQALHQARNHHQLLHDLTEHGLKIQVFEVHETTHIDQVKSTKISLRCTGTFEHLFNFLSHSVDNYLITWHMFTCTEPESGSVLVDATISLYTH